MSEQRDQRTPLCIIRCNHSKKVLFLWSIHWDLGIMWPSVTLPENDTYANQELVKCKMLRVSPGSAMVWPQTAHTFFRSQFKILPTDKASPFALGLSPAASSMSSPPACLPACLLSWKWLKTSWKGRGEPETELASLWEVGRKHTGVGTNSGTAGVLRNNCQILYLKENQL